MYNIVIRNCLFGKFLCVKALSNCVKFSCAGPLVRLVPSSCSFKTNMDTGDKMEDGALPNDKWSKESVELFNQLNEMGGEWKKTRRDMRAGADGSRMFTNSAELEKLFQYAFFHNAKLQCIKAVVQFGLYTRGPVGLVHGGAIATILDVAMGNCAIYSGYRSITANLNVYYKRPIPLNTTTLVEAKIDKIEGRKVFVSGAIKTVDGCAIYSTATSIFIMPLILNTV
ncbi:Hypothetical predicted protein [Paramuricea clavata]|uniref:Acyl-coenzyme A thioesterase THEM4 n=1 Tax=Paramuricea clavata TaxID=317549 RepID=A0A7D9LEU6_PARCT|nr:Hypothetical predicted protein [Paramuricea clavata]